jgi:hypothetical protein
MRIRTHAVDTADMSRRCLLAATCLCLFGWLAPAALATPTWLPQQIVSNPTYPAALPADMQAMGAGGDIAAAWEVSGIGIVAAVRRAGSESFSLEEALSTAGDNVGYPSVAVNASGTVVVAWIDETTEQYEVAIRPPRGAFSAPIVAGPTGDPSTQQPSVAIDNAGDVLLGESDEMGGGHRIAVYAWRPAGGTFAVKSISEPSSEAYEPVVALSGAGDAVLAWQDRMGAVHTVVRAITRPAGGAFGSAQSLSNNSEYAFNVAAAIGSAGQAAVVWQYGNVAPPYRIEASTSASPAQPLSTPQIISPPSGNGEYPAVGVGGNGEVIAAWQQSGGTNTEDAASAPAGGSFGAAVAVGSSGSLGDPQVATDTAGDAVIAWGAVQEGVEGLHAVTRSATGVLAPEISLSATGEEIYPVMANVPTASVGMDSAGDALVGWGRKSDKTLQERIYDASGPLLKLEDPTTAIAGQPVTFTSTARDLFSGVFSTSWSFGDGTSTEGVGPSHIYANPGTYTVTAIATDGVGNSTSADSQITVLPAPQPLLFACATASSGGTAACPALRVPLRCVVPRLAGLSKAAAKQRLLVARCKLGKVSVARRYKHAKRLVVASQKARPGTVLAYGASVSVTLHPAPPARRRKTHRRR